jgi:hypothetical protein
MLKVGRFAVLFALAGLVLTACGQPSVGGSVIGMRTVAGSGVAPLPVIGTDAIAAELDRQLKEAMSVPYVGALTPGETPLDAILPVKQIERLSFLQLNGELAVQGRLRVIAGLRSRVNGDPTMTFGQKASINGLLDQTAAGLARINTSLIHDRMVDQARADVTSIGLLRVNGLVVPQVNLLIAAYQMHQLALNYLSQRASLQGQINKQQLTNPDVSPAQGTVNNMGAQISRMLAASQSAINVLLGLRAVDFPANGSGLAGARQSLITGKAAADRAVVYRQQALSQLGL